jgi:outer membrane protein assembly factor BamB
VLLFSPKPVPLYALSPSDGAVIWSQEVGGGIPPYVLGNDIYMSTGDETVILTLAQGRYAAEYYVYDTSSGYTSAEQVDLGQISHIVAGP